MDAQEFWRRWIEADEIERYEMAEKLAHFFEACCLIEDEKVRKHCITSTLKGFIEDFEEVLRPEP